jgi:RsiW-degrading membrane proteinase PrsW (M82 family)
VTTSIYGVAFILVGNLSGNAILLGSYIMVAAGKNYNDNLAKLVAVGALTVACLLHATWRGAGIGLNNILAVLKVLFLLTLFVLGMCAAAKDKFVHTETAAVNFNTHNSFSGKANGVTSFVVCLINVM